MPLKKEDTPNRIIKRRYEEKNKERRKAENKQFNTSLPTELFEEINAFLKQNNITKVDIILRGYYAFKEDAEKQKEQEKNQSK